MSEESAGKPAAEDQSAARIDAANQEAEAATERARDERNRKIVEERHAAERAARADVLPEGEPAAAISPVPALDAELDAPVTGMPSNAALEEEMRQGRGPGTPGADRDLDAERLSPNNDDTSLKAKLYRATIAGKDQRGLLTTDDEEAMLETVDVSGANGEHVTAHFSDKSQIYMSPNYKQASNLTHPGQKERAARMMMDQARREDWPRVSISGNDPELKDQIWLYAKLNGLKPEGYNPSKSIKKQFKQMEKAGIGPQQGTPFGGLDQNDPANDVQGAVTREEGPGDDLPPGEPEGPADDDPDAPSGPTGDGGEPNNPSGDSGGGGGAADPEADDIAAQADAVEEDPSVKGPAVAAGAGALAAGALGSEAAASEPAEAPEAIEPEIVEPEATQTEALEGASAEPETIDIEAVEAEPEIPEYDMPDAEGEKVLDTVAQRMADEHMNGVPPEGQEPISEAALQHMFGEQTPETRQAFVDMLDKQTSIEVDDKNVDRFANEVRDRAQAYVGETTGVDNDAKVLENFGPANDHEHVHNLATGAPGAAAPSNPDGTMLETALPVAQSHPGVKAAANDVGRMKAVPGVQKPDAPAAEQPGVDAGEGPKLLTMATDDQGTSGPESDAAGQDLASEALSKRAIRQIEALEDKTGGPKRDAGAANSAQAPRRLGNG